MGAEIINDSRLWGITQIAVFFFLSLGLLFVSKRWLHRKVDFYRQDKAGRAKWRYIFYSSCHSTLRRSLPLACLSLLVMFIAQQYKFELVASWSRKLFLVNIILAATFTILNLIPKVQAQLLNASKSPEERRASKVTIDIVGKLSTIACIAISLILTLEMIGLDLDFLWALGGIGGVALGFAARDFLGSLLATAIIYWDKPFIVGDIIRLNIDKNPVIEGVVERIEWRFTVIKPSNKRAVLVPNNLFITSMIENLSSGQIYTVSAAVEVFILDPRAIDQLFSEIEAELAKQRWICKDGTVAAVAEFDLVALSENEMSFKVVVNVDARLLSEEGIDKVLVKREVLTIIKSSVIGYAQRFNINLL